MLKELFVMLAEFASFISPAPSFLEIVVEIVVEILIAVITGFFD